MDLSEKWLLRRIRAGDRQACTDLVDKHYQQVYWYLLDLSKNQEQAADLTQDTFAKAWQALSAFRGESSFRTWFFAIARNEFLLQLRTQGRAPELAEYLDLEILPDPAPSAEENYSSSDLAQQVWEQVQRLPGKYREVIVLHYFSRLSLREVAAVLGIPPGTAKSRVNQAFVLLKEQLETKEVGREDYSVAENPARSAPQEGAC
ncbi:MAG: sigma-70 family RNA polymerase sigma factor [Candidatus Latescibacteria bacterium]|nr:sigma-70 family RNA polymerase sigma factor [Candidatus Latescibacterota bacterium]